MQFAVISSSLNPNSTSANLARYLQKSLAKSGDVTWIDLRDYSLPVCDGHEAYLNPQVKELEALIMPCSGLMICHPVYNYFGNAAAKNLIELVSQAMKNKVVGLAASAGGSGSYMAPMEIANVLMLDCRCVVVPRFVYATPDHFTEEGKLAPAIEERLDELAKTLVIFTEGLKSYTGS